MAYFAHVLFIVCVFASRRGVVDPARDPHTSTRPSFLVLCNCLLDPSLLLHSTNTKNSAPMCMSLVCTAHISGLLSICSQPPALYGRLIGGSDEQMAPPPLSFEGRRRTPPYRGDRQRRTRQSLNGQLGSRERAHTLRGFVDLGGDFRRYVATAVVEPSFTLTHPGHPFRVAVAHLDLAKWTSACVTSTSLYAHNAAFLILKGLLKADVKSLGRFHCLLGLRSPAPAAALAT